MLPFIVSLKVDHMRELVHFTPLGKPVVPIPQAQRAADCTWQNVKPQSTYGKETYS